MLDHAILSATYTITCAQYLILGGKSYRIEDVSSVLC